MKEARCYNCTHLNACEFRCSVQYCPNYKPIYKDGKPAFIPAFNTIHDYSSLYYMGYEY